MSKPSRTIHLIIAKDVQHLSTAKPKAKTWWCGKEGTSPGDIIVVYKTGVGFGWILEVVGEHYTEEELCAKFKLITLSVKVVRNATSPIDVRAIRANPILGQMEATRRSFQGTHFTLGEEELAEITRLFDAPAGA